MKSTAKESTGRTKRATTQRTVRAAKPMQWPTEHEIRLRAYEIYLQRGCTHGQALNDWLKAEQELLAEYGH